MNFGWKKKPNVSGLVIKTDYDTKISELEKKRTNQTDDKYNTTSEFNTLAASVFSARLTKHLLIENELKKLKEFSEKSALGILSIFLKNSWFDGEDGLQAYLIFQAVQKHFKLITNTKHITEWKPKKLSEESIKPINTSDNSLAPLISYYGYKK